MLKYEEGCEPRYATAYSAGADLKARVECTIHPGSIVTIPTGVHIDPACKLRSHELQVRLRSSTPIKWGLLMPHGVGTVDMDYTKEIMVLVYNFTEKVVVVPAGTAIAQLVFAPIYRIPTLPIGGKREGGFGSTDGGIS